MTSVGRPTFAMRLAIVYVLPEPVTPRRTLWGRPAFTRVVRRSMARGWSPRGAYSDDRRNTGRRRSGRRGNGHQVLAPRVEQRAGVRMAEHMGREDEARMHGLAGQSHAHLVGEAVAFPEVAAQTGGDHIGPGRLAAARARHDMVHGQPLPTPIAVLAGVAVTPQNVLLVERDPIQERLPDVDGQPDHRRQGEHQGGRPYDAGGGLHRLGLAAEEQCDGATGVGEMERLVGEIEDEDGDFVHLAVLGYASPRSVSNSPLPGAIPARRPGAAPARAGGRSHRAMASARIPSRSPASLTTTVSSPTRSMVARTIASPGMMRSARPGSRHGNRARSSTVRSPSFSRRCRMRVRPWPWTRAGSY